MDLKAVGKIYADYENSAVSEEIHPNDHMYNSGQPWYYLVGTSAIQSILGGFALSHTSQVNRVLDIPCGHGRVARQLRAAFPNADIYFCDIDREGVEFCADKFAGTGIHSRPDLTTVALPGNMDLIWVGSLFTHVDYERTQSWVRYLVEHLAPKGLLVATFHGAFTRKHFSDDPINLGGGDWSKIVSELDATGYGYARYADESIGDYGISIARASRIMDMAGAIKGTRIISYTERGWAYNHDVLTLTRQDRLEIFLIYDSAASTKNWSTCSSVKPRALKPAQALRASCSSTRPALPPNWRRAMDAARRLGIWSRPCRMVTGAPRPSSPGSGRPASWRHWCWTGP